MVESVVLRELRGADDMTTAKEVPEYPGPAEREELARLDQVIGELDVRLDTPQGLMREHLTAARSYLIGAMPEEYRMTLDMAKEYLSQIEDVRLRSNIEAFLKA
jgi:hypothetical protein